MDINVFAFFVLITSLIATCRGQLDIAGLMEGMGGMMGGGGAIGGMMGGGGGMGGMMGEGGGMGGMMGGGGAMGGMGALGGMGGATGGLPRMASGEMSEMLSSMGAAGFGGMGAAGLSGMGAAGLSGMGAAGLSPRGAAGLSSMGAAGTGGLDVGMLSTMGTEGLGAMASSGLGDMNSLQGMMGAVNAMGAGGSGTTGNMMQMMMAETIANFKMTEIVKAVLGPHAHPNDEMIKYAKAQKKWPATIEEMVPYMNLMLELSKTIGIYMPDGTVKKPAVITTSDRLALLLGKKINKTGANNGSSQPSLEEVRTFIIQRGILWFQSQKPPKSVGVFGAGAGATG